MFGSRGAVLAASLLVLLTAAVGGVGAQSDQVTIRVTVVDGDGDPVSGATVAATWGDGERVNATTHSSGETLMDVPAGANVSLSIHDDRYVRNSPYVLGNASQGAVTVGVLEQGRATITVRDDSGLVDDARVQLYRDGELVVDRHAGNASTVTTAPIAQGTYTLAVFEGDRRHEETIEVDSHVNHTVRLGSGTTLLTVDVTDGHYDPARSVSNATVTVDGVGTVQTLAQGRPPLWCRPIRSSP
ncbi:carboxypeptidase-like regulatory domain-containing protein [Haloarculaceae archaeon H-GB2-1]|nr:carboxypeptidase-like regulatory domain-containing protein [Haloarculaceae archaeon H-GB2-1]